jgi:hypothetical protein
LYATFKTAFSQVQTYAVIDPIDRRLWQNLILAASTGPLPEKTNDTDIQKMLAHLLPIPEEAIPPFTDEFAPVDRYLTELGP